MNGKMKMKMRMKDSFEIRPYTKKELACCSFYHINSVAAVTGVLACKVDDDFFNDFTCSFHKSLLSFDKLDVSFVDLCLSGS